MTKESQKIINETIEIRKTFSPEEEVLYGTIRQTFYWELRDKRIKKPDCDKKFVKIEFLIAKGIREFLDFKNACKETV